MTDSNYFVQFHFYGDIIFLKIAAITSSKSLNRSIMMRCSYAVPQSRHSMSHLRKPRYMQVG